MILHNTVHFLLSLCSEEAWPMAYPGLVERLYLRRGVRKPVQSSPQPGSFNWIIKKGEIEVSSFPFVCIHYKSKHCLHIDLSLGENGEIFVHQETKYLCFTLLSHRHILYTVLYLSLFLSPFLFPPKTGTNTTVSACHLVLTFSKHLILFSSSVSGHCYTVLYV